MAKFVLEINLGDEEMKDGYDVGTALLNIACHLRETQNMETRKIHDVNGNTVGSYKVE